jgi:putative acetyltransferase
MMLPPRRASPLDALEIRRVTVDDYADVRFLHAASLTAQSADVLSEAEVAAFVSLVASPAYSDLLAQEDVVGGWIGGNLVGTASWQCNSDDGSLARIGSVFVRPLFVRLGIGRRLLTEVESHAAQSGFTYFGASATANAIPFFERLGYQVASRGVKPLSPTCTLPVAFMRKTALRTARSVAAALTADPEGVRH